MSKGKFKKIQILISDILTIFSMLEWFKEFAIINQNAFVNLSINS